MTLQWKRTREIESFDDESNAELTVSVFETERMALTSTIYADLIRSAWICSEFRQSAGLVEDRCVTRDKGEEEEEEEKRRKG